MKRFIWGFMLVLPLILIGCEGGSQSSIVQTQVVGTMIAASYTATPINTPHPSEGLIVSLLNANLQASSDALSQSLDATYTVERAFFPPNPAGLLNILEIKVRCECARDGECCNVEHTFVVTTEAMKMTTTYLIDLIPGSVNELIISCNDHDVKIGAMSVPWAIMQNYLNGISTTGYQLGEAVKKGATPTP